MKPLKDNLERIKTAFVFLANAAAFIFMLKLSWQKWGDLLIDSGRDMFIPQAILSGRLLYRDIFYLYGPFSSYLHAALFGLGGVHLRWLVLSGILTAAATAFLAYKISRIFLGVFSSGLAALTFITVFAFGHYVYLANYNFIIPHSYPAIHAVLFSLAALYAFFRSLSGSRIFRYAYVLFAALVFLCRWEVGLWLVIAVTIAAVPGIDIRQYRGLLFLAGAPLILAALSWLPFMLSAAGRVAASNLREIIFSNLNFANPFTAFHSGIAALGENLAVMLKSAAAYALLAAFFILLARLAPPLPAAIIACAAVFFLFAKLFPAYDWQYRCLPLICLAGLIFAFRKIRQDSKYAFLAALALFSLLMLGRVFFFAWAGHYGFYLLAPGMLVYYIFFLEILPRFFRRPETKTVLRAGFIFLACLFVLAHLQVSGFCYRSRTLKIQTPRGTLFAFPVAREQRLKELIDFLREKTAPAATLAVFPEGLGINFFSGRDNPLYCYSYLPQELSRPATEEAMLRDLAEKQPDYVAIVQRDTSEYGPASFGQDYGGRLSAYISENYELCRQFGPYPFTGAEFGAALLKKRRSQLSSIPGSEEPGSEPGGAVFTLQTPFIPL